MVEYSCYTSTMLEPMAKLIFLVHTCKRHLNAAAVRRSTSKELLGNDFSTRNSSMKVGSAVPTGFMVGAVGGHSHRSYCCPGCPQTSELMKSKVCLLGKEGCILLLLFIDSTFSKSNLRGVFLCFFFFLSRCD